MWCFRMCLHIVAFLLHLCCTCDVHVPSLCCFSCLLCLCVVFVSLRLCRVGVCFCSCVCVRLCVRLCLSVLFVLCVCLCVCVVVIMSDLIVDMFFLFFWCLFFIY